MVKKNKHALKHDNPFVQARAGGDILEDELGILQNLIWTPIANFILLKNESIINSSKYCKKGGMGSYLKGARPSNRLLVLFSSKR